MTRSTAALAVISTFVRGALAHAQDRSPLHGSLTPGPHAVGFSIVEMTDPTRYVRPERDATGPVDPAARARRLKVHLWYPALGFSGAGFSQLLLAMRHPDIDAVCDLESAIFDDRVQWPLQRGWGYDVAALRVPFLHTYSVPLSKLEVRIEDFEKMRYSTRYGTSWTRQASTIGTSRRKGWPPARSSVIAATPGPGSGRVFETTNRYVLAFFNAYVKGNAQELAFLRRAPEANGAPAGLATIRELPGIEPAATPEEFLRLITERGVTAAMAQFDAERTRDPQALLFREDRLNALAYRLLRTQKTPEAIALFRRITELYPASSNAYDSLSEALETSGAREEAQGVTRQGLEVLERQDLTPEACQRMAGLLRARLKRLS